MKLVDCLGLLMNIVGTLLIAFSFGKNQEEAHQEDSEGRPKYLASFLHPKLFKWGIGIVIAGFMLQFIHILLSP